jgi:hypothetical protein
MRETEGNEWARLFLNPVRDIQSRIQGSERRRDEVTRRKNQS